MILFRGEGPHLFRTEVDRVLRRPTALKRWYLSVIDELAQQRAPVWTCSIQGLDWNEIDCHEDLEDARDGKEESGSCHNGQVGAVDARQQLGHRQEERRREAHERDAHDQARSRRPPRCGRIVTTHRLSHQHGRSLGNAEGDHESQGGEVQRDLVAGHRQRPHETHEETRGSEDAELQRLLHADGGTEAHPVGTVCFAVTIDGRTEAIERRFGDLGRELLRQRAVREGLLRLYRALP